MQPTPSTPRRKLARSVVQRSPDQKIVGEAIKKAGSSTQNTAAPEGTVISPRLAQPSPIKPQTVKIQESFTSDSPRVAKSPAREQASDAEAKVKRAVERIAKKFMATGEFPGEGLEAQRQILGPAADVLYAKALDEAQSDPTVKKSNAAIATTAWFEAEVKAAAQESVYSPSKETGIDSLTAWRERMGSYMVEREWAKSLMAMAAPPKVHKD